MVRRSQQAAASAEYPDILPMKRFHIKHACNDTCLNLVNPCIGFSDSCILMGVLVECNVNAYEGTPVPLHMGCILALLKFIDVFV